MTGKQPRSDLQRHTLAEHRRDAPPAPAGNARSLKHGTRSERALAPIRQRHAEELRRDYPQIDERRLALLADRLASVELAAAWLDERGTIVRTKAGQVFDVADRLAKWNAAAWRMLTEVEVERRALEQAGARFDFAQAMSSLEEQDAEGTEDGEESSA